MSKFTAFALCLCLGVLMCTCALAQDGGFAALPTPTPEPTLEPAFDEAAAPETPAAPRTPEPSVTPTAEPEELPDGAAEGAADGAAEGAAEGTTDKGAEAAPDAADMLPGVPLHNGHDPLPEDAPACGKHGCRHIGIDERGEVIGLCELGRWLLANEADHGEATELSLTDGENIIYCGGAYQVSGGGKNARLYVRGGRDVSLALADTDLLTLKLGNGAKVSLAFSGRSTVQTLAAGGATLVIDGTGSLTVQNNLNCDALTVLGGSVSLPAGAVSRNGNCPVRFEGAGVSRVTFDGDFLTDALPDALGMITLWLPPLKDGRVYTAVPMGATLQITRN